MDTNLGSDLLLQNLFVFIGVHSRFFLFLVAASPRRVLCVGMSLPFDCMDSDEGLKNEASSFVRG